MHKVASGVHKVGREAGGCAGLARLRVTIPGGADVSLATNLLFSYGLKVLEVGESDAVAAAQLWQHGTSLSLGDRLCLALGKRLDATVLTADKAWGKGEGIEQIR